MRNIMSFESFLRQLKESNPSIHFKFMSKWDMIDGKGQGRRIDPKLDPVQWKFMVIDSFDQIGIQIPSSLIVAKLTMKSTKEWLEGEDPGKIIVDYYPAWKFLVNHPIYKINLI